VTKTKLCSRTAAVLFLGCGACGDPQASTPGGSTDGIDTSTARIRAVSRAVCEETQRCNPGHFAQYTGLDDCVSQRVAIFPLAGMSGDDVTKCQDATLDLAACMAELSCAPRREQEEVCGDFYTKMRTLCAFAISAEESADADLSIRLDQHARQSSANLR
jgi:hypothetical protein